MIDFQRPAPFDLTAKNMSWLKAAHPSSPRDEMQTAIADLLVGNDEWSRNSLADPFCGQEDARH